MTEIKTQQNKILSVTRDSGANVKLLKKLESVGFIIIHDVMLENGRKNQKVKSKSLPVMVLDHSRLNECVLGGSDSIYKDLLNIIGKDNVEDAMHLEAHIRNGNDYFITEDTDFLNKRDDLKQNFGVNILTPRELEKLCNQ